MNDPLANVITALSEALLASLWQGAVIGAAAAASLHLMRKSTPQARYLLACVALASCVVLPALTLISALAIETGAHPGASRAPWQGAMATANSQAPDPAQIRFGSWAPYLVWSWFAGCSLLLARTVVAATWLQRAIHKPQSGSQHMWQLRIDSLAARMSVTQPVRLLLTSDLPFPAVARIVRPVVFLPMALTTRMPTEWIEALLAHELAHIRRHDYLINLLQKLIEAALFHQPAVWWLSNRIRHERELIADSIAVEAGVDRRTLAVALADLADLQDTGTSTLLPGIALSARGGRLMSRIHSLIRPTAPVAIGRAGIPAIALVAVAVVVSASSEIPTRQAATPVEPAAAVRQARAAVLPALAVKAGLVFGDGTEGAAAPVAQGITGPKASQPLEARDQALKPQIRLAPLGGLSRQLGAISTPIEALETRMTGRGTHPAKHADGDRYRGTTP